MRPTREYMREARPLHERAWKAVTEGVVLRSGSWEGGFFTPQICFDLGCGRLCEAARFVPPMALYVGVDLDPPTVGGPGGGYRNPPDLILPDPELGITRWGDYRTIQGDYRDIALLKGYERTMLPKGAPNDHSNATTIVSLFSSEITADPETNRSFYEKLFETFPKLGHVIVSGFYYEEKIDENPVVESGGLTSWQTNWRHGEYRSEVYSETRFTQPTPSTLSVQMSSRSGGGWSAAKRSLNERIRTWRYRLPQER